jgi:nitroimidazol reductase NimA-like FMN-containing flavoprotein (pyridoxamine 5'-phosphate oxidase superfamily)
MEAEQKYRDDVAAVELYIQLEAKLTDEEKELLSDHLSDEFCELVVAYDNGNLKPPQGDVVDMLRVTVFRAAIEELSTRYV